MERKHIAIAVGVLLIAALPIYLIFQQNRSEQQLGEVPFTSNPNYETLTLQQSRPSASNSIASAENPSTISPYASEAEQLRAIEKLARSGTPAAIREIAILITSLQPGDLREEAVRIASTCNNPEAVPASLELLQASTDSGVIRMTQEIFARLADPVSIQSMLDIYDASADPELRDRLERTVAHVSTEEAVPVLKLLVSDTTTPATDGMIRASAQALRQIGTAPAVDALIERLNTEQNEEGRSFIGAQIDEVRKPTAENSLHNAALGQSKSASQSQTRLVAIGSLLNFPSVKTQELLSRLISDSDPQISEAASEILAEIGKRLNAHGE